MKSITEHLRCHIHATCGIHVPVRRPPWESLRRTEWSEEFEERMRNRLLLGSFRYGLQAEQRRLHIDRVSSMIARLNKYASNGNQEHLVDVAAIAMAEYIGPMNPKAHWSPSDDGEHGRITERKSA